MAGEISTATESTVAADRMSLLMKFNWNCQYWFGAGEVIRFGIPAG